MYQRGTLFAALGGGTLQQNGVALSRLGLSIAAGSPDTTNKATNLHWFVSAAVTLIPCPKRSKCRSESGAAGDINR